VTIFDSVLVDTSTLVRVNGSDSPWWVPDPRDPAWDFVRHGGIEALVLFDRVVLDGVSVHNCYPEMHWLEFFDDRDIRILDTEPDEERLYERAALLFRSVDWSPRLVAPLIERRRNTNAATVEIGAGTISMPSLRDVLAPLWKVGGETIEAFLRPFRKLEETFEPVAGNPLAPVLATVVRLFYYLALQELTGGVLLIHPDKNLGLTGTPEYGPANSLMRAFDSRVRTAYDERCRRWLGRAVTGIEAPALGRLAVAECHRRGWNLGRTVGWLRQQPEVRAFRTGVRQLDTLLDREDHAGVDGVLAELQDAADACSRRLGAPVRPRGRFSLQASIPFLQPAVEIPVPLPAHSPAQRMLGLMTWAAQS
jgi:hypothetical protein